MANEAPAGNAIPSTLGQPGAAHFWLAIALTGIGTGAGAAALTRLLEFVQRLTWGGSGTDLLNAARHADALRHVLALAGAGLLTGAGQIVLKRLSSGNGIDTTEAIWFHAGRMPAWRTLGSAVLSIFIVGMGASLGREGAPKQVGAVFANFFADRGGLPDEQRRLLVACGAGAGMAAAYGVPLGGALFALEVMRGALALRYVMPALFTSLIAAGVSWMVLPDAPTYIIPGYTSSAPVLVWAMLAGPIAGLASVGYVRLIRWADRHRPEGWQRVLAPFVVLGLLGVVSIRFPEVLGNGRDVSQLAFTGQVAPVLLLIVLALKPAAIILCMRSGAPGGLFTPSLTVGAMLGGVLGLAWSWLWPGVPQGPISTAVLMMELTGRDRSFILPLLLAIGTATVVARSIELRSIYDARLTDEEVAQRRQLRDQPAS